jgi:hypothetical protein
MRIATSQLLLRLNHRMHALINIAVTTLGNGTQPIVVREFAAKLTDKPDHQTTLMITQIFEHSASNGFIERVVEEQEQVAVGKLVLGCIDARDLKARIDHLALSQVTNCLLAKARRVINSYQLSEGVGRRDDHRATFATPNIDKRELRGVDSRTVNDRSATGFAARFVAAASSEVLRKRVGQPNKLGRFNAVLLVKSAFVFLRMQYGKALAWNVENAPTQTDQWTGNHKAPSVGEYREGRHFRTNLAVAQLLSLLLLVATLPAQTDNKTLSPGGRRHLDAARQPVRKAQADKSDQDARKLSTAIRSFYEVCGEVKKKDHAPEFNCKAYLTEQQ